MLNKIKYNNMISKVIDNFFPVSGGAVGALIKSEQVISNISVSIVCDTIILAAIGAIVGYFIKLGLDYMIKRIKNKKRS